MEKAHDEHWIEKQKILKLDLDSPLIKARGSDTITENRVPQNRETREKMKKSRLKNFNNIFYIINQMIYKGLYSQINKGNKK